MAAQAKLSLTIPIEIDWTIDVAKTIVHKGSTIADEAGRSIGALLAVSHTAKASTRTGIGADGAAGNAPSLIPIKTEGTGRGADEVIEVVAGRTG
jgi:hypothetical protein